MTAPEPAYEADAWTETMAAAGWPEDESIEDKVAADLAREREQAYWASPEGVAEQIRQHRRHSLPRPDPGATS